MPAATALAPAIAGVAGAAAQHVQLAAADGAQGPDCSAGAGGGVKELAGPTLRPHSLLVVAVQHMIKHNAGTASAVSDCTMCDSDDSYIQGT